MSASELLRKLRRTYRALKRVARNVAEMRRQAGESLSAYQERRRLAERKQHRLKQRFLRLKGRLRIAKRNTFHPAMANGHPYEHLSAGARRYVARAFHSGLVCFSTYEGHPGDGVHADGSYHYTENDPDPNPPQEGHAADMAAASMRRMVRFAKREMRRPRKFLELLSPAYGYVKNGVVSPGYFPGHGGPGAGGPPHVHGATYK